MKNLKEEYEYQRELFSKCLKDNENSMRILKAKDELIESYMITINENKIAIRENNTTIQQYKKEIEELRKNISERDREIEVFIKEREEMKSEFDKMMLEATNKSKETHRMQLQKVENE
mmetsp:Transcript_1244/g.1255  ORF Transcript_1244/g.1255 Transcript_1244/m.1255 type:complete len:118 (+) Transcript_1244:319-672(+)